MPAIAGIYDLAMSLSNKELLVKQMVDSMKHRGSSYTASPNSLPACLGIGSSAANHSDYFHVSDGSSEITLILDGEIFDYDGHLEYREGDIHDGYIILDSYNTHGDSFPASFDGSFSLALWDAGKQKLFLARDRLGTKPLYYWQKAKLLMFASEIKGILAAGLCEKTVSLRAINDFLSFGYVPNPSTMFESIHQVKPGHVLIIDNGKILTKAYWTFRHTTQAIKGTNNASEEEYINSFKDVFRSAVVKRVKKRPKFGAFLSGGLDTSSVVAMMRSITGVSFKVFTAGFRDQEYNEISDAKILVDHLNLDHYTTIVELNPDFPKLLEKLVWHHDSPFADTSAIPSYYLAKLAREHLDTVFTGDFPDQLIGGSGHQLLCLKRQKEDPFCIKLLRDLNLNRFLSSLDWSTDNASHVNKLKRWLYRESFSLEEQRIILMMPIPPLLKKWLYTPDLYSVNKSHDPVNYARYLFQEKGNDDLLSKLLSFDILSYAPDDLMVKVDRMSMAHGLNTISPFHDRNLVEFVAALPSNLKIMEGVRKYILREAIRKMLPDRTLTKTKQGFAMPIAKWLRGDLANYVRDIMFDPRTLNRGYFNKKAMIIIINDFLRGKTDYATGSETTIISLLTLELWHRLFQDLQ